MSVSHERKLQGYLSEKYFRLFKAFFHKQSDSKGIVAMTKKFFDSLPEKEVVRLQEYYRTQVLCSVPKRNMLQKNMRKKTSSALKQGRKGK